MTTTDTTPRTQAERSLVHGLRAEHGWVEEMGGMNLFFVFGSGGTARLVTPELTGSLLPGITRDSLLQLATDAGFAVEERKIDVDEWQKKTAAGEITEFDLPVGTGPDGITTADGAICEVPASAA